MSAIQVIETADNRVRVMGIGRRGSHMRFSKKWRRSGGTLATTVLATVTVLVVLVVVLVVRTRRTTGGEAKELSLFCAGALRYPIEQIAREYQREYGVTIELQFGGSDTLLGQLEVAGGHADLFVPADSSYTQLAREKGLTAEAIPLATMRPVIAARKDSKTDITSIDDLLREDVRVAGVNPDTAAIGRLTRILLQKSGHWDRLSARIEKDGVYKPMVNEVANDIKIGSVDAGIIWDATAAQYPELQAVRVPELAEGVATVDICVLNSTRDPTAALRFARYVAARDKGLQTFARMHFNVLEGDVWEEVPELTFFAGSVTRRALEAVIKDFAAREGVEINTVFNGCGILTGQMQILAANQDSRFPDTYMACDIYYLETVKDWYQEAVNVSDTDIVIAVEKGNPKAIRSLKDLLSPGVRVAVGQPDQCTIGALTRRLLRHEGIYEKLLATNVVAQKETSALLVPAVTTGAADAAMAYRTDTLAESDKVDVIQIDSPLAKAIQPFSIARSSQQKQ
ncbi:MAG: molybdate ABC transporter substrate-binding protein, partial [Planctomycetes bacterium]|nr:molybdate ABC transporter substrate-binding protein [Planctomycetota bacterium]